MVRKRGVPDRGGYASGVCPGGGVPRGNLYHGKRTERVPGRDCGRAGKDGKPMKITRADELRSIVCDKLCKYQLMANSKEQLEEI